MRGKSYFKNVLSEAEDMYSNASGRRSAFRGQAGGGLLGGGGGIGGLMCYFQSDFGAYGDFEPPFSPYSGCTDSRADNFNPDACYEDMSCSFSGPYAEVYSQEYLMSASQCQFVCSTTSGGSTTGGGITDSGFTSTKDPRGKQGRKFRGQAGNQQGGCGSPLAMNYDPNATCNDGSCVFEEGCTLIGNLYYNPDAVIDDGSCANYIPDLCDTWECPINNVPEEFDSYADYVASTQTPSLQNSLIPSCSTGFGTLTGAKDPKKGMRSASGGGKTKVATAVNWLSPLI